MDDVFNGDSPARKQRPHALVLPLPGQGHINPMLHFSMELAARRNFIITFVNTEKAHKRMLEAHQHQLASQPSPGVNPLGDIRFASIPDGIQQPLPGHGGEDGAQIMAGVREVSQAMEARQGLLEAIVVESRATLHPITCFIADSSFRWAHGLALKLGLRRVIVWTTNAATLALAAEVWTGKLDVADYKREGAAAADVEAAAPSEIATAGLPLSWPQVRSALPFGPEEAEHLRLFAAKLHACEDAACIVVNTFQDLEGPSLHVASALLPTAVRPIGPLLPPGPHFPVPGTSFFPAESDTCMAWLDTQAPGSVLYVSFGSAASLPPRRLQELALGIEDSKRPFLWVVRNTGHLLPDGFLDRTSSQGLVVGWAPQVAVLQHVAIGGFLTHCGWNSTLESISMGVPMLCCPVFADQQFNELIITKIWGLGLSIQQTQDEEQEETIVTGERVAHAIVELMSSQELHIKAALWKTKASHAMEGAGSSSLAIEAIINDLTKVA